MDAMQDYTGMKMDSQFQNWGGDYFSEFNDMDLSWLGFAEQENCRHLPSPSPSVTSTGSSIPSDYSPQTSPSASDRSCSSPPEKRSKRVRCPVKRRNQRDQANVRERRRMNTINGAFEGLRSRIPLVGHERKLSKVDTLRLAISYIQQLSAVVRETAAVGTSCSGTSHQDPAKVIVRCAPSHDYYHQELNYQNATPLYGHSLSWSRADHDPSLPSNRRVTKLWVPAPHDVTLASSSAAESMTSL